MSDNFKVFVGNIPFNCTEKKFIETFDKIDGFVKGDIIKDQYFDRCRGFGFVLLDSVENVEKIKKRDDIYIDNRQLRFTDYINSKKISYNTTHKYIYIDNIPEDVNREYLKKVFNNYEIGKYFINTDYETGGQKTTGMVEIKNYDKYIELLTKGFILDCNENKLYLQKWKYKNYKKRNSYNDEHNKVFPIRRNLGLIESQRIAKTNFLNSR
jgi:RNA recognition motif-containing protein